MDSEKWINSFEINRLSHLVIYWTCIFLSIIFELLLYKINVLDIFNMVDFLMIFVVSRSTEILIESTLRMYVLFILKSLCGTGRWNLNFVMYS